MQNRSFSFKLSNLSFKEDDYVNLSENSSLKDKFLLIARDSIPIAIAHAVNQLIMSINLYFVGTLDETEVFDGVGFGSTWMNLTNTGIIICLNVGFVAMASQAFGAKNHELVGYYYHKAIIIGIIVYIPCSIFIINSQPLLLMLNIKPEIAEYATDYMISLLPSTFIYIFIDASKNLLFARNNFLLPVVVQLFVSLIHPLWCKLFLNHFGLGYYGVSAAMTITQACNLGILIWFIHYKKLGGESWFWFNSQSFQRLWPQFVKEFFIGCLLYLEWLAFEGCLIISGSLSEAEMAAQVIVFTLLCIMLAFTSGLGVALNTYIGKAIGAGSKEEALGFLKAGLLLYIISVLFSVFILYFFIDDIADIYTSDKHIKSILIETVSVYLFIMPGDFLQTTLSAVLRAIGLEKIGAVMFLISFYGFGLPGSYILAIDYHLGIAGIWLGLGIGVHILLAQQIILLFRVNWEKQIQIVQQLLANDKLEETHEMDNFSL